MGRGCDRPCCDVPGDWRHAGTIRTTARERNGKARIVRPLRTCAPPTPWVMRDRCWTARRFVLRGAEGTERVMPELPDLEYIVAVLGKILPEREIVGVRVRNPVVLRVAIRGTLEELCQGQRL